MEEEKMIDDTRRPEEYEQGNESSEEMGNDSETSEYDFDTLNLQLDELNSALDQLEQKNDLIHAQLVDLLQSNRETREHFQAILASFEITRPQG